MKIAITAASGKLGRAIINELKNHTEISNIIGIARTPEKANDLGVEIRKADYSSKEDFNKALNGIDAVLIVSGMDEPQKRIQQHRNIIEAAKNNALKKIVYTSIIGGKEKTKFSAVIESNRQTEDDIKNSGLDWVIGRNGLYIEPDLEYIENYKNAGAIINCAENGKTSYTSRAELAFAYSKMVTEDKHIGNTYNLVGEAITQQQLAGYINEVYNTKLSYKSISVEDFIKDRQNELGEFMGTIIGGIYTGIRNGDFCPVSNFEKASGRSHKTAFELINEYRKTDNNI